MEAARGERVTLAQNAPWCFWIRSTKRRMRQWCGPMPVSHFLFDRPSATREFETVDDGSGTSDRGRDGRDRFVHLDCGRTMTRTNVS